MAKLLISCESFLGTRCDSPPLFPGNGKGEGKANIPSKTKYLKVHKIWDEIVVIIMIAIAIIRHSGGKSNSETIWGQGVKILW